MKCGLMELVAFGPRDPDVESRFKGKPRSLQTGQRRDFKWTKSRLIVKLPGEDPAGFQEVLDWGSSGWCCIPECSEAELRSNEKVISFSAQTGDRMLQCELCDESYPPCAKIKDIYITDDMEGFPCQAAARDASWYSSRGQW